MSALGLLAGSSIAAGVTSVVGGIQARKSAKSQERALEEQAEFERQESVEDAKERRREARIVAARQGLAFLKSGVRLSGSAALVQDSTRNRGKREADRIVRRGAIQSGNTRKQADLARRTGRNALIGGLLGGAQAASNFAVQKRALES